MAEPASSVTDNGRSKPMESEKAPLIPVQAAYPPPPQIEIIDCTLLTSDATNDTGNFSPQDNQNNPNSLSPNPQSLPCVEPEYQLLVSPKSPSLMSPASTSSEKADHRSQFFEFEFELNQKENTTSSMDPWTEYQNLETDVLFPDLY